jgi:hypothetical protein
MNFEHLLSELRRREVVLKAKLGQLRYKAPAGAITPEIRKALSIWKAQLLANLTREGDELFGDFEDFGNGVAGKNSFCGEREKEKIASGTANSSAESGRSSARQENQPSGPCSQNPHNPQNSVVSRFGRQCQPVPDTWPDADAEELLAWFATADLPMESYNLKPWCRIVDPARFYESLREDIARGPAGPHVHLGCVLTTLRSLREFVEQNAVVFSHVGGSPRPVRDAILVMEKAATG